MFGSQLIKAGLFVLTRHDDTTTRVNWSAFEIACARNHQICNYTMLTAFKVSVKGCSCVVALRHSPPCLLAPENYERNTRMRSIRFSTSQLVSASRFAAKEGNSSIWCKTQSKWVQTRCAAHMRSPSPSTYLCQFKDNSSPKKKWTNKPTPSTRAAPKRPHFFAHFSTQVASVDTPSAQRLPHFIRYAMLICIIHVQMVASKKNWKYNFR